MAGPQLCMQLFEVVHRDTVTVTVLLESPICHAFERKSDSEGCRAGRGATGFLLVLRLPFLGSENGSLFGLAAEGLPSSQECEPGRSHQCEGQTKGSQAQPNLPMKPTDLLTATVFGKRAAPVTSPRVDPILGSKIWTPKWGPP